VKYSKYFGAKRHGFIKSKSVLVPKGAIHLLNENIRYDTCTEIVSYSECHWGGRQKTSYDNLAIVPHNIHC
jgi:hypothetical protein